MALHVREAQTLRQSLIEKGYEVVLRTSDVDDPMPGLLEIRDRCGNRVDLLLGLRGMDPELLNPAMKAFAGGPVDPADARAVMELDRESLDVELLRRLAQRLGPDVARIVEDLLGAVDEQRTLGCAGL